MKKLALSKFDLGFIIAFAVVTVLGIAGWWYLSGNLQTALQDNASAKSDFDKYSTKAHIVVLPVNSKTLKANIEALRAQLEPLIETKLQPKENTLQTMEKEDPVAWKHDLDTKVHALTNTAKLHGVAIPDAFYFGFSRYLNASPSDEQTLVLSKQLAGVEQLASILISGPVRGIQAIRRTYEEDPRSSAETSSGSTPSDHLMGSSVVGPANTYVAYPFELDFETTTENLRPILDNLIQSPYLFIVRSISVENTAPKSPLLNDLERLASTGVVTSVVDTAPGEVAAAAPPPKGPQYLFGNSTLKVHARVDMIEWTAKLPVPSQSGAPGAGRKKSNNTGGNR